MSQRERVLGHLEAHGDITSLEAINDYGITRLSAVIFNLRDEGYNIRTKMERGVNRFGEETHFARYILEEEEL